MQEGLVQIDDGVDEAPPMGPGRQRGIGWGRQWQWHESGVMRHQEVDIEKGVRVADEGQSGRRTQHSVSGQGPVAVVHGDVTCASSVTV